ncbi:MAG: [FeFe] hydrogenase H-cluster maturation GTPase HydF [Christensenellales bacterium]|jgi:[FeFe] hydrogenase H-cluster maturation GTPase HydF
MAGDLNKTPRAVRMHIAFFGKRNAGKSSLINAITGQEIAIVSDVKGTTTDPVYKSMEILPLGPCELIDTAGLDDDTALGVLRMQKSMAVLNKTDLAVFVTDALVPMDEKDEEIIRRIQAKNVPLIIAVNKGDLGKAPVGDIQRRFAAKTLLVSAETGYGIGQLIEAMAALAPKSGEAERILGDLIGPGDFVVLVTPIDESAPKGRLILPQQQVIRDILESDAIAVVTKGHELQQTFSSLARKPKLVITDSQVFFQVAADTPEDIMLTSFSILFARFKGNLNELVKGAASIGRLRSGDKILIAEACTHHQQADDIGRVKIPRWLRQMTGQELDFEFVSGGTFGKDLEKYALIVHCGGCMINRREMVYRVETAQAHGVPIVNYGVLIACVQGILDRVLQPFPLEKATWEEMQG